MAFVFQRRLGGLSPFRIFFWVAVFVGLLLVLLDRRPFVLHADDEETRGSFESEMVEGDVLVVISEREMREGSARGEFHRPYAWVDTFRQEYGPVSVIDSDALDGEIVEQFRFIILTHSAAKDSALQRHIPMFEAFVTDGGVLVLELPQGAVRKAFSSDGQGGWRTPSSVTAVHGADDDVAKHLMNMPLVTRFIGSTRPLEGTQTHLAMDGAPVVYSRPLGRGHAITVDFAFAVQLSALQQGTPGDRMRVRPRRSGEPVRTTDLIAAPRLFGSSVPYADILEQFIVHSVVGVREPLFFLWPYPNAAQGALLTSHQSRYVSGRPLWMSVHERNLNARTVTFVAPPDPQSNTRSLTEPEHSDHAALLWVVDPRHTGLQKAWGIFGFYPIIQPLSLKAQRRGLTQAFKGLRDKDIQGIRTWSGRWDTHFVRPFRKMQAHGFRYDTSYGPVPGLPQGYLFGTCQPFQPVDVDGMPFALLEVPVCFIDPSTDQDLQLVGRALRSAAESMGVVHILTSSDTFRDAPDMRAFDAWRDMLHFAKQNDMWIGGAGQFIRFRNQRARAQLHVAGKTREHNERTGARAATRYVLEIEVPSNEFTLAIPLHLADQKLLSVVRGVALSAKSSREDVTFEDIRYAGHDLRLIRLAPGFTTLTIRYGK